MDNNPDETYQSFIVYAVTLWSRAIFDIRGAMETRQFDTAIAHLAFVSRVLAIWPVPPHTQRHQRAMLLLLEDTTTWIVARRDGGDVYDAKRNLDEAHQIACYESVRLFRDGSADDGRNASPDSC